MPVAQHAQQASCRSSSMSPISSRKSVPPSACCNARGLGLRGEGAALVAEVRSRAGQQEWPRGGDEGAVGLGECLCSARATSSLPRPDSPVMGTVTLLCDSRPMARNTSPSQAPGRASRARPACVPPRLPRAGSRRRQRMEFDRARQVEGLGEGTPKAPPWKADTALSRSLKAVMMMTGRPGCFCLILSSRSRPEPPGMQMSLTRDLRSAHLVVVRRVECGQHLARVGEAARGAGLHAGEPSRARSVSIGRVPLSRSASCSSLWSFSLWRGDGDHQKSGWPGTLSPRSRRGVVVQSLRQVSPSPFAFAPRHGG